MYGSGGSTSYTDKQLADQLGGWASAGFTNVKMKIGAEPGHDPARIHVARQAIGPDCNLFVDANGAYTVTQAIELAHRFASRNGRWFEEPVSSDHLEGLTRYVARPLGMDIAAGEYGYAAWYFRAMLERRQSPCCRQTAPDAAASAALSMQPPSVGRTTYHFLPTADPACIFTSAVPFRAQFTWNSSTITHVSSACLRRLLRTCAGLHGSGSLPPGMGLELKEKDESRFRV